MAQKFDEMWYHIAKDHDTARGVYENGDIWGRFISIPDLTQLTKKEAKVQGHTN
jgi:hypothetical protein